MYVAGGAVIKPAARRTLVTDLEKCFRVSERRACKVLCIGRSTHRYRSLADYQAGLRMRIKEIAAVRVRYGYKRIHVLLQREGWGVNYKQVYRIYCEEGLNLGTKRPRKRPTENLRVAREEARSINDCWSMGFYVSPFFQREAFSNADRCRHIQPGMSGY